MPSAVFISYRRDDAAGDAGRLADHLYRRFGRDRVFLDIDTIDPGSDFVNALRTSLERTAAVLVVIGPRWLELRDADGRRRLDDSKDFVRLEVEAALGRGVPVVPVLVQGAAMPRADDLPPPLASLATRQAVTLDHHEFHDDAERLCDRLEKVIGGGARTTTTMRRWWSAAAVAAVVLMGAAAYLVFGSSGGSTDRDDVGESAKAAQVEGLRAEAEAQQRRQQSLDALATLARARELAPDSGEVRAQQEQVAMDWIRNVRVEGDTSTFTDAIKPAVSIIDASLPSATGSRRADLLAHSGWAAFLMWRDGNRSLNPQEWYRDALAIDPTNPYANAMLGHWLLFQDDQVEAAGKLFETARSSGRALDDVLALEWAAYANTSAPEAVVARLRLVDAMRRQQRPLTLRQAQSLWAPYYFALSPSRTEERAQLLDALPPEDHLATLPWAFDEYARGDESRQQTMQFYAALLQARAGRRDEALAGLRKLETALADRPGSLQDAVKDAVGELSR